MRRLLTFGIVAAIATFGVSVLAIQPLTTANADHAPQGTVVSFLVKSSDMAEYADGIIPGGSSVLFTGAPSSTFDSTTCGGQSGEPVQDVILRPGQGAKRIELVAQQFDQPIEAGTELLGITFIGTCTIDEIEYQKYEGTVQ